MRSSHLTWWFPVRNCARSRLQVWASIALCLVTAALRGELAEAVDGSGVRTDSGSGIVAPVSAATLPTLTLAGAEALFREGNRELRLAARAVELAEAERITASARPNPTLSVSMTAINPRNIGAGPLWDKRIDTIVGLSQTIERGGKRELRMDVAQAGIDASTADRAELVRQALLALHTAYFDLKLAQERQALAERNAGLFSGTIEAAQRRLAAGDIATSEVSRLRVDALRAENDARTARGDREKARAVLAYLIGMEGDAARISVVDAWPVVTTTEVPADAVAVVERRADVVAARARVRAAEKARDLARASRTRDVTVFGQLERYPVSGDSDSNSFGLGASIPLFTNHRFEGEIRRAETEWGAARDSLARVLALAHGELARARADLETTLERARRFEQSLLREAERAAEAAEFAYGKGALGVMDLLDARRTLQATRLEALVTQAEHAKARAAWASAITPAPPGEGK